MPVAEIQLLDIAGLKGQKKAAYKKLTKEKFRICLSGQDPYSITGSQLIAISATENEKPIGLLLGAFRSNVLPAELYTLFVDPKYLKLGIEKEMLHLFETILREKKSPSVKKTYQKKVNDPSAIEILLKEEQWEESGLVSAKCYFDAKAFNTPWLHQEHPLPRGCEQFMWHDLKEAEKKQLEYLISQHAIPRQLSPFGHEKIDWKTSIGLRNETEVVGWIINVRPKKDIIEFKTFFVFRDFSLQGHAIRLLTESIHLVQKKPPKTAFFEVHMNIADRSWIRFIKARLLPYAFLVKKYYTSEKYFSATTT